MRNKNKNNLSLILLLIILLLVLSTLFFVVSKITPKPLFTQKMAYDYNVTEHVGFVLDEDMMHFGSIPSNGHSNRSMNITGSGTYLVKIRYEGDGYLVVNENHFILQDGELKKLEFQMYPINKTLGHYNGTIYFDFYEPK